MLDSKLDIANSITTPTDAAKLNQRTMSTPAIFKLRHYQYDARDLEVAEEEAGMAVRRPDMFDRVVQALHTLGAERDTEHSPPTK